MIISCIIVLLPPLLPFQTSSGQPENTVAGAILMVAATISLLTATFAPHRRMLAVIAILLAVLGLYLAGIVATHQQRQWGISAVPVAFVLGAFTITAPRWQTPLQRIAGIGAALLFLVMLYAISITHIWWQFILLCIGTYILLIFLLRYLRRFIPRLYVRRQIYYYLSNITIFAIVMVLILGFFNFVHFSRPFALLLPGTDTTLTITLLTIFMSQGLHTRTCILLWSSTTILLVLVALPFQTVTLSTFLVAALAILLAVMAVLLGRVSLLA